MLDAETSRTVFDYDECTGIIRWKIPPTSSRSVGDIAGCIDSYGYRIIHYNNRPYKAHRLAWLYAYGEFPCGQIDHINHKKDDNRLRNLRDVTGAANQKNRPLSSNNKSGVTGVFFYTAIEKWRATIDFNRSKIFLGSFESFFDAVAARKSAELAHNFHENHGK